jgi:hypothetical protein
VIVIADIERDAIERASDAQAARSGQDAHEQSQDVIQAREQTRVAG